MAGYFDSVEALIGNTPLVELKRWTQNSALQARLFAKLEMTNPGGSAKDRVARQMILDAEEAGILRSGGTLIEPTSGNTGIGLALMAALKGYHAIIVMPESMSVERQMLMKAFGAELVLTPAKSGMAGAVAKAKELAAATEGAWLPDQFANPSNPKAHYMTTGPEIWEALEGKVDIFVAGIGTGGTISGVGKFLKEKNPTVRIIGIEPASSPLLTKGQAGAHGLQGIGANFVPDTLDREICDEILTITEEEAFAAARRLTAEEGILAGISAGAALHGASVVAQRTESCKKHIVVLLPDTGERYLSAGLFA